MTPSKRHFFVIEKCSEDVKQDEKHVLDLLESIMRPKLFVKEELRPILFKITQFGSRIFKKGFWKSNIFLPEVDVSLLTNRF